MLPESPHNNFFRKFVFKLLVRFSIYMYYGILKSFEVRLSSHTDNIVAEEKSRAKLIPYICDNV